MNIPGLLVAGTRSGSGKTSCALALMAAFRARGLQVQPFKVGPDFIDPTHHQRICGRPSWNLDTWMCGLSAVERCFDRACAPLERQGMVLPAENVADARPADIRLVEGVMGLFDGADAQGTGSSAEIARHFGLPVLLLVDSRGMGHSVAALAHGFSSLCPDLSFAGIVCSHVGSARHAEIIRESFAQAAAHVSLPPLLGMLLREDVPRLPSRHLGLHTAHECALDASTLAAWIERHLDLDALLERMRQLSHSASCAVPDRSVPPSVSSDVRPVRIGLSYDAAFPFLYPDLPDMLRALGAEPVFFSPLADALPTKLHGLMLSGGYPELFAEALASNTRMCADMHTFIQQGKPVYAECGGFIWLMKSITVGTNVLPMLGVLPLSCTLEDRYAALGYRVVSSCEASPFGRAGTCLRGHEFHYARLHAHDLPPLWQQRDRLGREIGTEGVHYGSIMASWVHLHFASNPEALTAFVRACQDPACIARKPEFEKRVFCDANVSP